jgi:hypothetical protein
MAHFKGEVSFTADPSCVQTLYTGNWRGTNFVQEIR